MRIVVCVKQVPESEQVRIDPERKTLVREGVPMVINPLDEHALALALDLREAAGAEVVAVSMGPPSAEQVLRHAVAVGADRAVLVCDRALAGSDTLATSRALAAAIEKLGGADLVLCGNHSTDGETGHVGPQIAELLGWPQVTSASAVRLAEDGLQVERTCEGWVERVAVPLPAVVAVLESVAEKRRAGLRALRRARTAEIEVWGIDELGLAAEQVGLAGSPTQPLDLRSPEPKPGGESLEANPDEAAEAILKAIGEARGGGA